MQSLARSAGLVSHRLVPALGLALAMLMTCNLLNACAKMMPAFTALSPLTQLDPKHNGGILPRNINLLAFNPHRKAFHCVHEADALPVPSAEAEALFQQGLRYSDPSLYPSQREYVNAAQAWQQAAKLGHWKAQLNLADLYLHGRGRVDQNLELGVSLVEQAMQRGVADAFYFMGTLHENGLGVNASIDRAFAFYDVAVDLGSARAQGIIGKMLNATWDSPTNGFWANLDIGRAMLECSYAQGDPIGTYNLAGSVERDASDTPPPPNAEALYARALQIYQDGAKFGSLDSVDALVSTFYSPDPMNHNIADKDRAARYKALSDALYNNPDLKFPNLDKVLPLPPAQLPVWNGNKEDLVNAAKAVVTPPPKLPPHPGSSRNNTRYYVPPGMTLPTEPLEVLAYWPDKALTATKGDSRTFSKRTELQSNLTRCHMVSECSAFNR
ncbi:MAG: DUF6396 domain-containing protein [Undibacterium curvum]|uniref:SEL1-like repeat protein n=1 Tax=Undibacterium curvum TaxID=2762294 RepID=UPI003BE81D70